jgi:acyl-CoA reductase-like NAD-dependent aldehyde dehydrogenase
LPGGRDLFGPLLDAGRAQRLDSRGEHASTPVRVTQHGPAPIRERYDEVLTIRDRIRSRGVQVIVRDLRAPFGGFKDSGIGREGGKHSREFFTEAKTVVMEM